MCSVKPAKPASQATPPAVLPKPLADDEEEGEAGLAQLRVAQRNNLRVRSRAAAAAASPAAGLAAPQGAYGGSRSGTPAAPPAPRSGGGGGGRSQPIRQYLTQ